MINRMIYLSIVGVLLIGTAFADEKASQEGSHVLVGERPLSLKIQERVQTFRAEKNKEFSDKEMEKGSGKLHSAAFSTHGGAFHHPISVSLFGDTVELEDGSIWNVHADDKHKTLDWMTGDMITITPSHSWFSSYNYILTNVTIDVTVWVKMTLGPIYNGIYTHWIIAIDHNYQEICLEDGSVWDISTFDRSIVRKWLPNDTIIIGTNDGWFSSYNPHILINVNTNSYANASCVN